MSDKDVVIDESKIPVHILNWMRWREQKMKEELNEVLQQFQKGTLLQEQQMNLRWNAINAIVRLFYNKGLVTNEELTAAGKELFEEAKENMKRIKEAKIAKTKPDLTPTALETAVRAAKKGQES